MLRHWRGLRVLRLLCQGPVAGTDFSTGMLAQARRAHTGAGWVRADARAQPITSRWFWALAGFDLAMRARNAVWRPPFVMYYRTWPLRTVRQDLAAAGFTVTTIPLSALGQRKDGSPRCGLVLARKASSPS